MPTPEGALSRAGSPGRLLTSDTAPVGGTARRPSPNRPALWPSGSGLHEMQEALADKGLVQIRSTVVHSLPSQPVPPRGLEPLS
jgi:hypothetical protein